MLHIMRHGHYLPASTRACSLLLGLLGEVPQLKELVDFYQVRRDSLEFKPLKTPLSISRNLGPRSNWHLLWIGNGLVYLRLCQAYEMTGISML